ncbi:hypothetical protein TL18_10510 [Methanobrevibacter sp. YE315]|nr:hypothetical protein TL18_10510 [Methanobrevibacter sp. YE315]
MIDEDTLKLDSINESSDSAAGLADDARNTDEIGNDGCLTYVNKAPVLGVSNDEPILGRDIHASQENWQSTQDFIDGLFSASPGDVIYLDGRTFTNGGSHQWWQSNDLNGITVYGGSSPDDTRMATFQNGGYTWTLNGVSMTNVLFKNIRFTASGIWDTGGGSWTNVDFINCESFNHMYWITGANGNPKRIIDCDFIECHQTDDSISDGHGQMGNVAGVYMENCNFINTSSANHGGALCVADESDWGPGNIASQFINTNFINVTSRWFAVYVHGKFSTSTGGLSTPQILDNCKFINCVGTGEYSGGLGISHDGVQVYNSDFINCTGGKGGAIMVGGIPRDHDAFNGHNEFGNDVIIDNCNFIGNVAKIDGQSTSYSPGHGGATYAPTGDAGAVFVIGNRTIIRDSVFDSNVAGSGNGAAVYISGQDTTIQDTEFKNHESVNGTVYILGSGTKVIDSQFHDNDADHGAGIYVEGNRTEIRGSTFEDNTAKYDGAGVYIDGQNTVISSSTFKNNDAVNGAGVFVEGNDSVIDDSTFEDNEATDGAGVYIDGQNTVISGSTFKNNDAVNGAGVFVEGDDSVIDDSTFEDNRAIDGAGVYIEGHDTNITDSTFRNNVAEDGAGAYIEGDTSLISGSTFEYNNASNGGAVYMDGYYADIILNTFDHNNVTNQGGAVYIEGSGTDIKQNIFTYNEAVPASAEGTTGLGGAIYVKGDNTYTDTNEFSHNKARNGSAIYTDGNNFNLAHDTFFENQAWSYLLIITPRPEDSYYNTSDVNITVCHIGGDNIINAIHNTADNNQITFTDVTYKNSQGGEAHTGNNEHPVNGAEASQGGTIAYQDDREYLQLINITKILDEDGNNILADDYPNGYDNLTNIIGEIRLTLKKPIKKGTYTVYAEHPEDWNYKYINSTSKFRVYEAGITINKVDLNSTDFVVINDTVAFNITVNNTGDWFISNITVNDVFNASELQYIGHSNNITWNLTGNNTGNLTFSFNNTGMGAGDIYAYEINVTNTGSSDLVNVTLSDIFDPDILKYVSHSDDKEWINDIKTNNEFLLNGTLGAGQTRVLRIWLKNLVDGNLNINTPVVDQANVAVETRLMNTTFPLHANETSSFTIWFKALTNGTLVNNVTVKSNEANEDNSSANVTVYNPNMTVVKVSLNTTNVNVNETVAFNITVTNTGDCNLTNVTVTELFNSTELKYLKATGEGWTNSSNVFTYGPTLVNGTNATFTIWFKVLTNGTLVNNVTAKSNRTNETNDTANVTVDPICDLVINKTVNASVINLNESVSWTINVTNLGPSVAKDVVVTDTLDDGLELVGDYTSEGVVVNGQVLTWTVGDIDPYTSKVLSIVTKAVKEGKLNNTVVVVTSTNETNKTNNDANNTTQVDPICDLVINKTVNASVINLNESVSWTIVVSNLGPSVAYDVNVTDTWVDGLVLVGDYENVTRAANGFVWNIGEIAPYTNVTLTVVTKATKEGKLNNTVVVVTSTNETNKTNNDANNTTQVDPICDLVINKTVNASVINLNESVSWTIVVSNLGPSVAYDVNVTDTWVDGLVLVGDYENVTRAANGFVWNIGEIAPYTNVTLTVVTKATKEGKLNNTVVVVTSTNETNKTNNDANNTTQVDPICDLVINKTVNASVINLNESVSWTIVVSNLGPSVAYDVNVTDTWVDGLVLVGDYENVTRAANGFVWNIGEIAPYTNVTLTVVTKATKEGKLNNTVVVVTSTNETNKTNNDANNTTQVDPICDLVINKTVNASVINLNESVSWTIVVSNLGPSVAYDVNVTDTWVDGLVLVGDYENVTRAANGFVWNIGEIAPYTNVTLTVVTKATKEGKLNNTVVVVTSTNETNKTNNDANNTTQVDPICDLVINKTVNASVINLNESVSWTIVVSNLGPSVAYDVNVTDTWVDGLVLVGDYENVTRAANGFVWNIGEIAPYTNVTLTVVTKAIKEGKLNNTVVVVTSTNETNKTNNDANNTTQVDPICDLVINKTVNASVINLNESVSWTIVVSNLGPSVAYDVNVTDTWVDGLVLVGDYENVTRAANGFVWNIGEIAPYTNVTLTVVTKAIKEGKLNNTVVVVTSTNETNKTNNDANNTTQVDPICDLVINKTVNASVINLNESVSWTIVVSNLGPSVAYDVNVTDTWVDGLVLVGDYENVTRAANGFVWNIGEIAPYTNVTLTVVTKATKEGKLNNTVVVVTSTNETNKTNNDANNTTQVDPICDLVINKTVNASVINLNESVSWTIVVSNLGPSVAYDVNVTDTWVDGLVLVGDYENVTRAANGFVWNIGEIAPYTNVTLTVVTKATKEGKLNNTVVVVTSTNETNKTNNDANNTTQVDPICDLVINKTVNASVINLNESVSWTIVVSNLGPSVAYDVNVTDTWVDGLVLVGDYENVTRAANGFVWNIGEIAPYTNVTLTVVTKATKEGKLNNTVVVVTSTNETNKTNNDANNTTQVDPICDLVINKTVNASVINLNESVSWTIVVSNLGPSVAYDVNVTDTWVDGLVLVGDYENVTRAANGFVWNIGEIAPYTNVTLTVVTKATKEGKLNNTVVVVTSTNETNKTNNDANNTTQVDPICDLVINKTVNASVINLNESVSWTIVVSNLGPSVAYDVNVTDTWVDGLVLVGDYENVTRAANGFVWNIGEIAPYTNVTLTVVTKAIKEGKLNNTVVVVTSTNETNKTNNDANNTTQVDPICDLVINKTVNASVINLNESVSWTIVVSNLGPSVAYDVNVTDTWVDGLVLVGDYENVTRAANGFVWNIGEIAPYTNVTLTVVTKATKEGKLNNTVVVVTSTNETNKTNNDANNTTQVDPICDLVINKTVNASVINLNESVSWTIVVSNLGPSVAYDVNVTDTWVDGLVLVGDYENVTRAANGFVWNIGEIAPYTNVTLTVVTKATKEGKLNNTVVVVTSTNETNKTNNDANNTTQVDPICDLVINKTVNASVINLNESVSWTIVVSNLGPSVAYDVNVTDTWVDGLVLVGDYENVTRAANGFVWNIGEIAPYTNVTLTVVTKATKEGKLNNTVVVVTSTNETNKTNNDANNTTQVDPICDLVINKTVNASVINLNESVSWTIVVSNLGPSVAYDVNVTDTWVDGLVLVGDYENVTRAANGFVWNIGEIAPYTNVTLTVVTKATKEGKLNNTVVVVTSTNETNKTNNDANNTTQVDPICDLVINKTVNASVINLNESVSWTIVVSNLGPSVAYDVNVTDTWVDGLVLVGDYENVTRAANGFVWNIGEIAPYTNVTLTVVTKATKEGKLNNTVVVVTSTNETNKTNNDANNTTQVDPICDLVINKTVNASVINLNESVSWTIVVSNLGPSVAYDVNVTDTWVDGLVLVGDYENVTRAANGFVWNIGEIAPYTNVTLTVVTKATKEGKLNNTVVVVTSTNETNKTNNDANNTTQVDPICDLVINKTVNASVINLNESVSWTIVVSNLGPSVAYDVNVTDTWVDGLVLVGDYENVTRAANGFVWNIGEIAPYTNVTLTVVTKATKEGKLNNTVVVVTSTNETNKTNNDANNTTQVDPICDLVINKTVNASVINLNESVSWTIVVSNLGPSVAYDVNVTDTWVDGLVLVGDYENVTRAANGFVWNIGEIAPYTNVTLTVVTKAIKEGKLNNTVVVVTSTNETNKTNNDANNTTQVDPICDLVINKTVNASVINLNESVSWTIVVSNLGPSVAYDVNVTDTWVDGLVLVGDYENVTRAANGFVWNIGEIAPYTNVTLTVVTKAIKEGKLNNTVVVVTSTNETNKTNNDANNTTQVDPICDLVINKTVNASVINLNESVSWTIVVSNLGPSVAKDVYVFDTLDVDLDLVGSYENVTRTADGFVWNIGEIAPYTNVTLTVVTKAIKEGNLTNKVYVVTSTNETNTTNNNASNSTQVDPICDVTITKEVNASQVLYGESVEWTITVTNDGPSVAEDVVVTDTLPVDATVIGKYDNCTVSGGILIWNVGDMDPYTSKVLKFVTQLMTEGNNTNFVVVNTTTNESDHSNNEANNTTFVISVADLEINKTVSNDSAHKGDVVEWTITVHNNGPNAAVNVTVVDVIPDELIYDGVVSIDDGSFDGEIWFIDEVASGDTVVLVIKTTVNATNATIVNNVNVTSDTYDPDEDNNNGTNNTVIPPEADLEVIKAVLNESAHKGDVVNWIIVVVNHGPDTAVDAVLDDVLPDELIYNGVVNITAGKLSADGKTWTIGNMTFKQVEILVIRTIVNATNMSLVNEANVSSVTYDPNMSNNNDSDVIVIPPEADLSIIKTVSNVTAHKGDVVNWTIVVTNNGPDTAVNVVVNDVIPSGLAVVNVSGGKFANNIWTVGNLTLGESATLIIETLINATNATIVNNVNTTSDTYDPNESNNNGTNNTFVPPEADLAVTITNNFENSTDTCHNGDTVVWTITVTNNGPDTAVNSILEDVLPDGVIYVSHDNANGTYDNVSAVWSIGDLPVGETVTLTITTIANTTNATVYRNVSVSSDTYDPDLSNNYDNSSLVIPPEADLAVTITNNFEDSNTTCHNGDTVVWTITVTNNGPDTAVNSILEDVLPDGVIYVSHDNANGTYDNVSAVWSIGDLPVGETVTLTITTIANTTNATVYRNVSVSSDTYDPDLSNNYDNSSLVIPPEADLAVTITNNFENSTDTCHNGDTVVWTITVTNNGPNTAVNSILKDVLPDGMIYVSDDSDGAYNNETAVWTIGDLPVGETVTLKITTTANTTDATVYRNVSVSSDTYDPDLSNNYDNSSLVIPPEADLEVIKSNDHEGEKCYYGDPLNWDITVINHGPNDAINAIVTDKLPDGVEYVSDDSDGAYDPETGVWNVGNLTSGASVTLHIVTIINDSNVNITNPVNVTSDTYDPNETNNKDNSSVNVVAEADLEIIKLVSNSTPHKNDKITWTIIVTNNGRDTAVNAVVSEKLPAGVVYLSDDSNGAYDSELGIWNVGNLTSGASATLNIVTLVDTTNKTIINIANVTSDTFDPNETNNKCNNSTTVPPEADLVISVEPDVTEALVGENIVWTITVVNQGPDTAINSTALVAVPDELQLLGFEPSKGTYDPDTGIWTIGDLAPGEEVTLLLNTKALVAGEIVVEALTYCDTYESDLTNNYDNATVNVIEPAGNETEPPVNVPITPKMHATGNPIVMVLLSLLAIVGLSLKRKS